jgi:acetoin utilization deacetylase AcuC-like enzyme
MIGYMYDPRQEEHDTGYHIETFRRALSIHEMISSKYTFERIPIREDGKKEELEKVHDKSYIDWVESGYENGVRMIISSDTILSRGSYEVALRAATSTKNAVKFFKNGGKRAFLNLRPPGHHAEIITGQGFCIFNNVALMARYAQEEGYEKVLIIDFDVHHGNGTQDIFYKDDTIFYFSTHEEQNYPFTGSKDEIGEGKGEGFTKNLPYKNGITDEEFLSLYEELPISFDPDIVLVSAGYDLMRDEEISSSQVTFDGLEKMIKKIIESFKDKPIAFVLEGGYNIDSLIKSVDITFNSLRESCSDPF